MYDHIKQIYLVYYHELYRFVAKHCRNPDHIDDIVQNTFVEAMKSLETYKSRSSIKTWLFGIAKHQLYRYFRKNKMQVDLDALEGAEWATHNDFSDKLLAEQILATINDLEPPHNEIMRLRLIDDVLESLFLYERSADMKTEITAEIDFSPVAIDAKPASELNITEDEINDRYYHLSYDPERRNKATALRRSESAKLSYEISFGPFSEEYDKLSKEQFIDKAAAILNTLQARQVPFYSIQVKALDPSGSHLQSISFSSSSSIQQLKDSYTTQGYDIYKK